MNSFRNNFGRRKFQFSLPDVAGRLFLALFLALWPVSLRAQSEAPIAPTTSSVIALAVALGDSRVLLAGTLNTPQPSSTYRSQDGGATWSGPATGLRTDISIAAIAFDATNPQIVLAADGGFGYLFRSTDGGRTWQEVPAFKQELIGPNSAVGELYAYEQGGQSIFHAGSRFDGVLTSRDGGQSWQSNAVGLQGSARRVRAIRLFNDALYAGTHDGLYRQLAGSTTWERVGPFPAESILFSLAVHQGSLYAGTAGIGVWRTEDGETWQEQAGFPTDVSVYDLASTGEALVAATSFGIWAGGDQFWKIATVDGTDFTESVYSLASGPGTVYAGTSADWVLRSDDGGESFTSLANLTPLTASGPAPAATATPLAPAPTFTPVPAEIAVAEPITETTEDSTTAPVSDTQAVDVPGADAQTATPLPLPTDTPAPLPPTDTPPPPPTNTPLVEAGTDGGVGVATPESPEAQAGNVAGAETTMPAEITQLPPVVVGVAVVLVIVVLVAGLSVLRGPREL